MDDLLNWLARTLHVLGAALWVGGYAALLTLVVPALARDRGEALGRLALAACRFLSAAGTLTILAGAVLIARTRGYGSLLGGEWGGIVIAAAVLSVLAMALGDSGLRPALRRVQAGDASALKAARRWALAGLLLAVAALSLMTRAPYARS
jgi:putative copper export protein